MADVQSEVQNQSMRGSSQDDAQVKKKNSFKKQQS
jgi:hypothetical protein